MSKFQHSCLYTGHIRHRRFVPVSNEFSYPIFMFYLDLDELQDVLSGKWYCSLNRLNFVSFWRKDYFGYESLNCQSETKKKRKPQSVQSLKKAVIKKVCADAKDRNIELPKIESVRLLTHLRYANMVFNPVTFYYCFDASEQLVAILAEITNTPWDERYTYVLHKGYSHSEMQYQSRSSNTHAFAFEKVFHVSPFNPMNMDYDWNFSEPGSKLFVHMNNFLQGASEDESKHFDATLVTSRKPLEELGKTLIRYPYMCVSVVLGIYWQAAKLWFKRSPFYSHPKYLNESVNQDVKTSAAKLDNSLEAEGLIDHTHTEINGLNSKQGVHL